MGVVISKHAEPTALRCLVTAVLPTEWDSSLPRSESISWVLPVRMLSVHGEFEMRREEATFKLSQCSDQARDFNCSSRRENGVEGLGSVRARVVGDRASTEQARQDLNVIITCACDVFAQE